MSYSIEELEHLIDGFEVKLEEIGAAWDAHIEELPDPAEFDSINPEDVAELEAWEEKRYWYQEMRNGLAERRGVLVDMLAEAHAAQFDGDLGGQDVDWFSNDEIIAEYESQGGTWAPDGDPTDWTLWEACVHDWSLEYMHSQVENGLG
ncbi:hypothetical protein LMG23992_04879 [Cupriavidus laharis]|uniref:Uncharacterized protein n=1 Tax=Cupriavidus laharis TaxID=151654 RepID=A0ABM8XRN2_9BURK|nr:hypothetical protein [Cupriavidus laharis]CAG9182998.1 hypothetical protein LMG23992_04879 [Cupriavidus laharis]